MCGIAGFLAAFGPDSLAAMNARIAHRGPDDTDTLFDPALGLGLAHRRLAIIDPSVAGRQPMWDATRRAVIIYNGEIYNYRELARELKRDGYLFNSATDTEVILNLYLKQGRKMLGRLNGIFAFALWDVERRELLLARDGFGVKPLYYAEMRAGFAFASELKALTVLPGFDRELDVTALSHYLTYLYSPGEGTPFRHVRKVLPGEALAIGPDRRITDRWRFFQRPSQLPLLKAPVPEIEEQLVGRLGKAIKRQMVADVPVGAFLSGGLDSSSIATFARHFARGNQLDCYTIGFNAGLQFGEGMSDDLPFAMKVANHLGVKLNTIWVGPEMAQQFDKMIYHLDEPQPDPAALNVYLICQLARANGSKVLLSGAGGDDIFTGYRRHRALMHEGIWSWLPRPLRHGLRLGASLLPRKYPAGRRLAKAFQYADRDTAERTAGYFVWLAEEEMRSLFHPDWRRRLEMASPLAPMLEALRELPDDVHPLNRMLYLDSGYFLTDHNMNYTDKMSMAAGVEVRVPFLDPELVALAASIHPSLKQHGTVGKWIFKRAMEPFLPHDVIYRAKTGFGAPLRRWLQHDLKGKVDDALAPETIRHRGLFDPAAVASLVARDRGGIIDASYPIFELICIETWCKLFLDN